MISLATLSPVPRTLDTRVSDLLLQYSAEGPHEHTLFVPTSANLNALSGAVDAVRGDLVAAWVVPSLRDYFAACLVGLETNLRADPARPAVYVQRFAGALLRVVREDPRPHAETAPVVRARLEAAPGLFAAVQSHCHTLLDDRLTALAESLDSCGRILAECRDALAGWDDAPGLAALAVSVAGEAARVRMELLTAVGTPRETAPEMAYADLLRGRFGIAIDELLAWHEEEIAASAEALARAAAAVTPGIPAPRLLAERAGAYPTPEAMFAAAHACLARARARARDFVDLPEGESCAIAPLPQLQESSYPWGAAHGFPPVQGRRRGVWYLNRSNWAAVTRGWVQMMAIHEVYPGHHTQNVKTATNDDLPRTAKAMGFNGPATPLSEGIAHRAEEQLIDLYDDPLFPVFVRLRRLHTAVRIKADLLLHHFGQPVAAAEQLYVDFLGFSADSARGQVHYQELHPGYMTCYYYGYKKLTEMRAASSLSEKAFTEITFASGYATLDLMRHLLAYDTGR